MRKEGLKLGLIRVHMKRVGYQATFGVKVDTHLIGILGAQYSEGVPGFKGKSALEIKEKVHADGGRRYAKRRAGCLRKVEPNVGVVQRRHNFLGRRLRVARHRNRSVHQFLDDATFLRCRNGTFGEGDTFAGHTGAWRQVEGSYRNTRAIWRNGSELWPNV